jgi:hypothetical protein
MVPITELERKDSTGEPTFKGDPIEDPAAEFKRDRVPKWAS